LRRVIGIELITIDARIVIASIETYLRFAEAVNRLDLNQIEVAGIDAPREGGSAAKEAQPQRKKERVLGS
jgi:gas vesicle structural protein